MRVILAASIMFCTMCSAAQRGVAKVSHYAARFAGHRTASGERYNPRKRTAASRTLKFGTCVLLSNRSSSTVVVVNDRGPWIKSRLFDISTAAAQDLRISGVAKVQYKIVPCNA